MKQGQPAIRIIALALWAVTGLTGAGAASASQPGQPDAGVSADGARTRTFDSVARELKSLQEGLAAQKAELAQLRHKWTVTKGRVPTEKELKDFEKKKAKGEAKPEDNPYFNKNPLSSPGRWREAYYRKLEEVRKDEERATRLERELDGLK
jgi:hypothetical protein